MKKYSTYLWAIIALMFIIFIGTMSYWYPVTLDEYFRWKESFTWEIFKDAYLSLVPRISILFGPPIFALGKWSFVLINSIIQFANCLCTFYILFMRLPNIKNLEDMPYFLTILCMSIFFVCSPSEVMFWLSGAINYSWSILFFLLMLCILRQILCQKFIFKDNWVTKICLFILCFIVGMSNECSSPVALAIAVCFGLFCNFKNIKTPRALSFMIFGLAIGCLVFFSAPAHYSKMLVEGVSNISSVTLEEKLFFHISHFNDFFKAQFFLPVITLLFLIIAAIDKDNRNFKDTDFWLSISLLISAFTMAFILFVVPQPPIRAYYPASITSLLSFLFLIKYFIKIYNFDFSKYLCYLVLGVSLFLAPRFIIPHYSLYLQEQIRNNLNFENKPKARVMPYFVLKGPTENLTITLMDPARRINIGNGIWITDMTEPINW